MRVQGTVREWKYTFGFITWFMETGQGTKQRQTFVHWRDLMDGYRELCPGDVVEFEVEADTTGRQHAVRVQVLQEAPTAA